MAIFTSKNQHTYKTYRQSGTCLKLLAGLIVLISLLANFSTSTIARTPNEIAACKKMHLMREKLINTEPEIDLQIPLKSSGSVHCFSPEENLFFASIIAAQNKLGPNAPWYKKLSEDNKNKSRHACIILGYDQNNTEKSLDECVQENFSALMRPYKNQYMQESYTYIKKRNAYAHVVMKNCTTAFWRYLPNLPDNIYFPLAYYDKKLHSYPDWYVKKRQDDIQWLQNIKNTKASDLVAEGIGNDCPGEMVWWLYTGSH